MRANRSADRYTLPDTATVTCRMAYLYKDSDSARWNFRTRAPSDNLGKMDDDRELLVCRKSSGA